VSIGCEDLGFGGGEPRIPDIVSGSAVKYKKKTVVTDEYNAISVLFDEITAAFTGLDLKRFRSCFYLPCMVISPQGVAWASSESEFDRLFRPMMDSLKARGFARSKRVEKYVKLQSNSTATASVLWIRFKKDGSEIERLGATYALYKSNANWKIAMVMVHEPDGVLRSPIRP